MEANYNNVINLTKEKLLKAFELSPENKWEEVENKEGFVVCTRTNPENGLKMTRSNTTVTFTPEQMIAVISDCTTRPKYDDQCESSKLIQQIDENTALQQTFIKSPAMLISARDVIIVTRVIREGDTIIFVATSVEHSGYPPQKGYVRAQMIFGGWVLKPKGNGQTDVTSITHSDPMGSIPNAVTNQMAKKQGEMVKKLVKYVSGA